MPNIQVKLRRGTTSQHAGFTGAEGEVTVDTDLDTLKVHDGSTAGGHELRRKDDTIANAEIDNDAVGTAQIAADAVTSSEISSTDTTFKVAATEVVVNEGGADIDFRVEGDTNANLIVADAGEDAVGIATAAVSGIALKVGGDLDATGTIAGTDVVESSGSSNQIVRSSSSANLGYVVMYSGGEGTNEKRVNLVPDGGKFILSWVNDDTSAGLAVQLDQATGAWEANSDNAQNLGSASARWAVVYAGTGSINTSDRNEKEEIEDLSEAELRVATAIKGLIKKFKFKGRVRKHIGVIAQDVEAAFTAEGLNASDYGLFCSDTFEDENGNTVTRLGVRYEELLAFIIAAM